MRPPTVKLVSDASAGGWLVLSDRGRTPPEHHIVWVGWFLPRPIKLARPSVLQLIVLFWANEIFSNLPLILSNTVMQDHILTVRSACLGK